MSRFEISRLRALGEDVCIHPHAEIKRPELCTIGSHVAIDSGVYITTAARIGDYTHISPYVTVIGGAKSLWIVGDFATVAAGSRMICGSDSFLGDGLTSVTVPKEFRDTVLYAEITIGRFCGVGTNAVIMPGVTLGEGSVVGACSFVTKNTEPWTIYVGSPARPLKMRKKEKMIEYAKQLGYL